MDKTFNLIIIAVCVLVCLAGVEWAHASSNIACGSCDLDDTERGRSECTPLSNPAAAVPTGPLQMLFYFGANRMSVCTRCPTGMTSCTDNQGRSSGCQFLNNNTDALNCGACGSKCSGETPSCVSGQCGCTNTTLACGLDRFCDLATPEGPKKCAKCPEFFANCASTGDRGAASDCEVDLRNSTSNCGACGLSCGVGETCVNGVCGCGSTPGRCPANTQCVSGTCTECTSALSDSMCRKVSWADVSGYCNPTTKRCETCPDGFADCDNNKRIGGIDDGSPDDCETQINLSGFQTNCGVCGASCGSGGATSCCSGVCKCGKFVDLSMPSNDECSAAVQCTETEYCEPTLQMCLPLYPPNRDCTRTANAPNVGTDLDSLPLCGSCNRTVAIEEFVVNSTCVAADTLHCGKADAKCRPGQICNNGKCACGSYGFAGLFWEPFMDKDRDRDNKLAFEFNFRSGCNVQLFRPQLDGRFQRSQASLLAFEQCITLARPEITRITAKDLRNTTFRETVCPGGAGKCPLAFCNEVIANLTERDRGSFCGTVQWASSIAKTCVQEMRVFGDSSGDLTCADNLALAALTDVQSHTEFNYIDMYNLLGCDKPRDDMFYYIGFKPLVAQYRVETAFTLLGAASAATVSFLVAATTLLLSASLVLT